MKLDPYFLSTLQVLHLKDSSLAYVRLVPESFTSGKHSSLFLDLLVKLNNYFLGILLEVFQPNIQMLY